MGRLRYATQLTDNITSNNICLHCDGSPRYKGGLVCIDDGGNGTLAPCPMCRQGRIIDQNQYNGQYWTHYRNPETTSWEHGLTNKHKYQSTNPKDYRPKTTPPEPRKVGFAYDQTTPSS